MKKLLLIALLILAPLSASAGYYKGYSEFWGWVSNDSLNCYEHAQGFSCTVDSWKFRQKYNCDMEESYIQYKGYTWVDYRHPIVGYVSSTPYKPSDEFLAYSRVHCKVRDGQCGCIYR